MYQLQSGGSAEPGWLLNAPSGWLLDFDTAQDGFDRYPPPLLSSYDAGSLAPLAVLGRAMLSAWTVRSLPTYWGRRPSNQKLGSRLGQRRLWLLHYRLTRSETRMSVLVSVVATTELIGFS